MTKEQDKIINGLQDLIIDKESFITDESDKENIFVKDKEILEEATKLIQEQQAEIEKKDKIINNMNEALTDYGFDEMCNNLCNNSCHECLKEYNQLIYCVKQYIERKVEEC